MTRAEKRLDRKIIEERRKKLGWTQEELAKRLGYESPRGYLSMLDAASTTRARAENMIAELGFDSIEDIAVPIDEYSPVTSPKPQAIAASVALRGVEPPDLTNDGAVAAVTPASSPPPLKKFRSTYVLLGAGVACVSLFFLASRFLPHLADNPLPSIGDSKQEAVARRTAQLTADIEASLTGHQAEFQSDGSYTLSIRSQTISKHWAESLRERLQQLPNDKNFKIVLRGCTFAPGAEALLTMPRTTQLFLLQACEFEDGGLANLLRQLAANHDLATLYLEQMQLLEADVDALQQIGMLRHLSLSGSRITPGLEFDFGGMRMLRHLFLTNVQPALQHEQLVNLSQLIHLQELSFSYSYGRRGNLTSEQLCDVLQDLLSAKGDRALGIDVAGNPVKVDTSVLELLRKWPNLTLKVNGSQLSEQHTTESGGLPADVKHRVLVHQQSN